MSRKIHRAPFALASDGSVLLNIATFDSPTSLESLFALARQQRATVFVGVALDRAEVGFLLGEMYHAHRDAAAWVVGGRQRRRRRRRGAHDKKRRR